MPLHPDFPTDPCAILHPDMRWYPGDELLGRIGAEKLTAPLVDRIRRGVHAWRQEGYPGASETTRALLQWWFQHDHFLWGPDGPSSLFQYRFGQREAVESAIWLYEVEVARDPASLMKFDSLGAVSRGHFDEDWARYVLKLATGAGKTKVMSLLIAWSYFHKLYEPGSSLSTNALLVAPNIIVLDRLRADFDGGRIFFTDPVLPDGGWHGRDWRDDFQMTVHIQDDLGHVSPTGNLFLTNIHRVGDNGRGLRRMFGPGVDEKVSVLGTPAFMAFVDEIKNEGVELERRSMGPGSEPAGPMVIEVDHADTEKDIEALEIELPRLKPRIERQLKDFEALDVAAFPSPRLPLKSYSAAEQRELTFIDPIVTGEISHTLNLDAGGAPDWRHVVGWFTQTVIKDLRLVGGFDVLFGKLKDFIEVRLFDQRVDLDDPNVLKNLADPGVTRTLKDTVKAEINRLTVQDTGTTSVQDRIKLSQTRPQVVRRRDAIESRKSMFNKIAGDNNFELAFARFLDAATDVRSFFKNTEATGFRLEYQSAGGGIIRDYYPDFVVRDDDGVMGDVRVLGL